MIRDDVLLPALTPNDQTYRVSAILGRTIGRYALDHDVVGHNAFVLR